MIYVSSSCSNNTKIKDSILELVKNGFYNIELSGGTKYYKDIEADLIELKKKYKLNFLLHNYFPPPREEFVLNLASLDDEIYNKSLKQYKSAILLSKKLGAKVYGIHAGYFIDFKPDEAGKDIIKRDLFDKEESLKRFCDGFRILKKEAEDCDIELYIENNVLSHYNYSKFDSKSPFMLIDKFDYDNLTNRIDFKLLLDIAHLKVSLNSIGKKIGDQLGQLISSSDYIHVSENNGLSDQNNQIHKNSDIIHLLSQYDLKNKNITLEIYGGLSEVINSYEIIKKRLNI